MRDTLAGDECEATFRTFPAPNALLKNAPLPFAFLLGSCRYPGILWRGIKLFDDLSIRRGSTTHPFATIWVLQCRACGTRYGSNSCDAHIRRCPSCNPTAMPGEPIEQF